MKLGLSLVLGVIAGIGLISLPALVSPTFQASNPDTVVSPEISSSRGALSAEPPNGPLTTSLTSDTLTLTFKLFLILLPGSVLSVLTRRWAVRKLEDY